MEASAKPPAMTFLSHYLFCTPPLPATNGAPAQAQAQAQAPGIVSHGPLSLHQQQHRQARRQAPPTLQSGINVNVNAATTTTTASATTRRSTTTRRNGRLRRDVDEKRGAPDPKPTTTTSSSNNNSSSSPFSKRAHIMTGYLPKEEAEGEELQRVRRHRCSRCGAEGHNVRVCPMSPWFEQRCGLCGMVGHNARNCTSVVATAVCRVCTGAGRLPCSKCNGACGDKTPAFDRGVYARRARTVSGHAGGEDGVNGQLVVGPPLSKEQKRMADVVRRRVRRQRGRRMEGEEDDELIGGGLLTKAKTNSVHVEGAEGGDLRPNASMGDVMNRGDRGGVEVNEKRCKRCMGTGYLTCMACTN